MLKRWLCIMRTFNAICHAPAHLARLHQSDWGSIYKYVTIINIWICLYYYLFTSWQRCFSYPKGTIWLPDIRTTISPFRTVTRWRYFVLVALMLTRVPTLKSKINKLFLTVFEQYCAIVSFRSLNHFNCEILLFVKQKSAKNVFQFWAFGCAKGRKICESVDRRYKRYRITFQGRNFGAEFAANRVSFIDDIILQLIFKIKT